MYKRFGVLGLIGLSGNLLLPDKSPIKILTHATGRFPVFLYPPAKPPKKFLLHSVFFIERFKNFFCGLQNSVRGSVFFEFPDKSPIKKR